MNRQIQNYIVTEIFSSQNNTPRRLNEKYETWSRIQRQPIRDFPERSKKMRKNKRPNYYKNTTRLIRTIGSEGQYVTKSM